MKKSRFDIEYNKWLQQVDVGEEDSVWNEIQDELDFMETWDNISAKLDEIKPQKGRLISMNYLKKLAAAAAVLLLVFFPVRHFLREANQLPVISDRTIEADEKEPTSSDKPSNLASIQEDVEESGLTESEQMTNEISASSGENVANAVATSPSSAGSTIVSEVRTFEDLVVINRMMPFEGSENPSFMANNLLPGSGEFVRPHSKETVFPILTESDKSLSPAASKSFVKIVDVGLVYGYKNTWLLNYETRNSLDPTKLGNIQPTFRQDLGISSTFELNNRYLFGLEFFLKSESGQNYQQYFNASFVEKNINLDYLKLQTFYCWENKRFPGQIIMGGYVARLTMAEEQIAETRIQVNDRYSDLDYGLLAGYQANIPVTKNMVFKPGIRLNYNLVNIFEGDNVIPGNFKDTRNLATSLNISFSYRFN
ncbi:hypothetical protein [Mariniphaga sp.]|uniref:hypothetical protein n=1 Tax=Mariniphaga sp. TaxID=1954475 RepID=UPI003564F25D